MVLVTGCSGLVGHSVVSALGRHLTPRGLDRRKSDAKTNVGDLRDRSVLRRALDGAWAVVHVAALHAPHVGVVADREFWDTNVEATQALLDEAVSAGVQRFVYTSSTSVYGHALVPTDERAVWVDEDLQPQPRDIYDKTKLAAEELVAASPIASVVLRIARCFPEPAETLAAHRLNRGVDVHDVAAAHLLALENPCVSGTFNVSGPLLFAPADTTRLWRDPAALITERFPGIAAAFEQQGWWLPNRIDRVYDCRLAAKALGYEPVKGVLDVVNATRARCAGSAE